MSTESPASLPFKLQVLLEGLVIMFAIIVALGVAELMVGLAPVVSFAGVVGAVLSVNLWRKHRGAY